MGSRAVVLTGLILMAGLAGATVDQPATYGPVVRPLLERAKPDPGRRFLASEPEPFLDDADGGVQVKWRGRKVKLSMPLG